MKCGKEIEMELPYDYKVVSGTVDNKNPKSVYIQISAWGKPKSHHEDGYESIIRRKSKKVKKKLYDLLNGDEFYKQRSIVDFDMASSGVKYDKRSFMSVEMTLFQKNPIPVTSEILQPKLKKISETIIKDIFENDEDFQFFKTKN